MNSAGNRQPQRRRRRRRRAGPTPTLGGSQTQSFVALSQGLKGDCVLAPSDFVGLGGLLSGRKEYRIRSAQVFWVSSATVGGSVAFGAFPSSWSSQMSPTDVVASGGTMAAVAKARESSRTLGAQADWKPVDDASVLAQVAFTHKVSGEVGRLEMRGVVELRGFC